MTASLGLLRTKRDYTSSEAQGCDGGLRSGCTMRPMALTKSQMLRFAFAPGDTASTITRAKTVKASTSWVSGERLERACIRPVILACSSYLKNLVEGCQCRTMAHDQHATLHVPVATLVTIETLGRYSQSRKTREGAATIHAQFSLTSSPTTSKCA